MDGNLVARTHCTIEHEAFKARYFRNAASNTRQKKDDVYYNEKKTTHQTTHGS